MRVHYVGKLLTGSKKIFASSFHTGSTPFRFKLGSSEVVDAWNDGLLGMCEGAHTPRPRARPCLMFTPHAALTRRALRVHR